MKKFRRFLFLKLPLTLILLSVLFVLVLKWVPVWVTPLMIKRSIEYRDDSKYETRMTWVSLSDISNNMVKAVIASEDNLFPTHNGFDTTAIKQALKEHERGKRLRGASTISQQTAKNVFTFGSHTWFRKGLELYYTFLIEKIWGKERIMEVYLNVAEMGPGIFGVEAAAQKYYKKSAAKLTLSQAARITACLPNPLKRSPLRQTSYMSRREGQIIDLTHKLAWPDWVSGKKSDNKSKKKK